MSKPTETPRERFLRVAGHRINKALQYIRMIEKMAGQRHYKYSEVQIAAMVDALAQGIVGIEKAFSPEPKEEKPRFFDLAAVESPAPLLDAIEERAAS